MSRMYAHIICLLSIGILMAKESHHRPGGRFQTTSTPDHENFFSSASRSSRRVYNAVYPFAGVTFSGLKTIKAGDHDGPAYDCADCPVKLLTSGGHKRLQHRNVTKSLGAIIRGDTTKKNIALVFTGDEFADGGHFISSMLKKEHVKASFFLTGNFYRNPRFKDLIRKLQQNGNYLGSHSDKHLLYCDWVKRDSLLVTRKQFEEDIRSSYTALKNLKIEKSSARYFLPPYEWYNDSIAQWTTELGLQLVNYSPGTRSNADYTYPQMGQRYVNSKAVMQSILDFEGRSPAGLNGFILLVHIGTDPRRTDKFYFRLPELISSLKKKGYQFVTINELLD